mmetsp:Transcript_12748/g.40294  ORF Transcript_12748/g.40294 Transcript_12748/m.40294 type:complete len:205 (+) Transcript_12748:186-800(+)
MILPWTRNWCSPLSAHVEEQGGQAAAPGCSRPPTFSPPPLPLLAMTFAEFYSSDSHQNRGWLPHSVPSSSSSSSSAAVADSSPVGSPSVMLRCVHAFFTLLSVRLSSYSSVRARCAARFAAFAASASRRPCCCCCRSAARCASRRACASAFAARHWSAALACDAAVSPPTLLLPSLHPLGIAGANRNFAHVPNCSILAGSLSES